MVGGRAGTVKAALVLLLITGCFWRSYGPQAATHTDVLLGMARKGADLVAGGRLSAESMPELTYPLERALAFANRAAARSGETRPESLVAFEALVARYREFVGTLDRVRREQPAAEARAALAAPLAAVEAAGERVREALRVESDPRLRLGSGTDARVGRNTSRDRRAAAGKASAAEQSRPAGSIGR